MAAEDVVAGFADDGDGVGGHQDQDWSVGAGAADAEVVQAAAAAQGELPNWSMVSWRMRKCPVGLCGGLALGRAVWAWAGVGARPCSTAQI
ncbi:hypothetical protein [Mycobacterium simiae]|uniref:hypothetical protein n=1 Tax=Mycobacterium simiae TaxID=1784 RepID=UPI0012DF98B1|nr:hypothetical protein [Mycobacterium simiae]